MKKQIGIQEFITALELLANDEFDIPATNALFNATRLGPHDLQPYVFFAPDRYTRNLIHRSDAFTLLLLCWAPGLSAPAHGHEGQKCWMRVEQGALRFNNYREREALRNSAQEHGGLHPQELAEGSDSELILQNSTTGHPGFVDGPAYIHSVENFSNEPAMSLHLYAHPFEACDVYKDLEKEHAVRVRLTLHSEYGKLIDSTSSGT